MFLHNYNFEFFFFFQQKKGPSLKIIKIMRELRETMRPRIGSLLSVSVCVFFLSDLFTVMSCIIFLLCFNQ